MNFRNLFYKLRNWEFWPIQIIYAPMMFYWFYLAFKAKSFFFFNTANPSIYNGGFAMESKKGIYDLIPANYYPKTILVTSTTTGALIKTLIENKKITFPIIAKPDIGQRGVLVKLLNNLEEVIAYKRKFKVNFLLQEFIDYPNEVGVFYCRQPNQSKGYVSGIVGKHFLEVIGDGVSTIQELIEKEPRYCLQLKVLQRDQPMQLDKILKKGERYTVVPFGNHSLGSKFVDLSHLIDPEIERSIDFVCKQIPGFYFGRLDIKYHSWSDLCRGQNFSIIELNGAKSEPTHIYDPKHSILYAWSEIIRHWRILYQISVLNAQREQMSHLSSKQGFEMIRNHFSYIKSIS
ncbi:hypothetical protein [Maribacter ulvicola]|uniref:ATP-grasp domain-containing protein n=1 Tax=Maribacter ulvicola TaxID=228959 RepID=A0A1N6X8F7_9FLAO|nr:hypothetical protein [Maribacter ulvicola]SIQ98583.1 hypothetical protein SAMN05421797_10527 [Maribacter ulvicola]